MLAGKGFTKIYNLSGGIKAWEKEIAYGPADHGMALFSGNERVEDCIIVAYGLEEGLRDFYLTMQEQTTDSNARSLFAKLAEIEVLHQQRLVKIYGEVTGSQVEMTEFADSIVSPGMEGGMTTREYLARFHPDLSSLTDILSLAMSIEAQALDLYQRASFTASDTEAKKVLQQIANEERVHIQYLADYMDQYQAGKMI
jgi:rubrerythrin